MWVRNSSPREDAFNVFFQSATSPLWGLKRRCEWRGVSLVAFNLFTDGLQSHVAICSSVR